MFIIGKHVNDQNMLCLALSIEVHRMEVAITFISSTVSVKGKRHTNNYTSYNLRNLVCTANIYLAHSSDYIFEEFFLLESLCSPVKVNRCFG
jgi:hypothetical protein